MHATWNAFTERACNPVCPTHRAVKQQLLRVQIRPEDEQRLSACLVPLTYEGTVEAYKAATCHYQGRPSPPIKCIIIPRV